VKQGKNPTREQKKYISSNGLYPGDWLVSKDTPTEMVLVHRFSTVSKILKKE
jgi:hypothetical protein